MMTGSLCISFDFELYWAFVGERTYDSYKANLLGVHEALPRMLELFAQRGIHASWGAVGLLMCEGGEELKTYLPETRPSYANEALSQYRYFFRPDIQRRLATDPEFSKCHFAPNLVRAILNCPGQELATHTFSHFYCAEPGPTLAEFEADILAAKKITQQKYGVNVESIILPRHQTRPQHLNVCADLGIRCYRGNQQPRYFNEICSSADTIVKKVIRNADCYFDLTGSNISDIHSRANGLINIPASFFLRPYNRHFALFDNLRLQRIKNSMKLSAQVGAVCHLWLHPHNFGTNIDINLAFLEKILNYHSELREQYNYKSSNMKELAKIYEKNENNN